ncbi:MULTISPECIES: DUF2304 domain-containing protein [unclassified Arthrobacter]|uniref:DUF2304 domain-containing protein n=1 Tax=unclassified Arthrobacter TaxID=235627 RepID=UPI001D13D4B6|nr:MULTISPECIES: DUF2304 domain-containing protein [unclassified Arthrobacter]MCC3276853.1 DUF2304 domain-containing protein [Arthrobacter sp. zg-Y20]MCC9176119.1 DUF2304 domain-containing protein [Arthrobacter sp. zg-Y750]MDK1317014.1 DUF2304 domain-containing protein [Arthrobacter sp. zg.Y20]WIB05272.1 DUF2304 domain-containing protein [Arthrobacter sp. zg-Y20]
MSPGSIITFAIAFLTVALVFRMLRRGQLREKYAILWLSLGVVTLVLTAFPQILLWTSQLLGVQVPANLIFAVALTLLVGVTLHLSWELSTVEEEARVLAEEVGILRTTVSRMEDTLDSLARGHLLEQPTDEAGRTDQRN